MSHEIVHFACVERVKIAFWTFDWIFVPWGFSGGRAGTLLGIPCWGQKIILNSEYSARVYYSTGRSFSQRVLSALMIRYFSSFSLLWSYSPKYTLQKRASTPFFKTPSPPELPRPMGCHKGTTTIIAGGQEKIHWSN